MLCDKIKIIGSMHGTKVLQINIDCLCPWKTIEKICDVLRDDLSEFGDGIDFKITVKDTDV
jgi:hypothetical protein